MSTGCVKAIKDCGKGKRGTRKRREAGDVREMRNR